MAPPGRRGGSAKKGRATTPRRAAREERPAVEATLRITSIAAGGAGVGRADGLVVFTPRTAPGDLVRVACAPRERLAHGRLREVLEASPHRVDPRCRHYLQDACGGCQLQHLGAEAQREAKRGIIADAFARIARRPVEVPPLVASPAQWEYRNKLTLAFRHGNGTWQAGLHRWDDVDRIFHLEECPITHPRVVEGWRDVWRARDLLPSAGALRGSMRLVADALALSLEGGDAWPRAREFAERLPGLAVLRWTDAAGRAYDLRSAGPPLRSADSFEQVNPAIANRLHADVVEMLQEFGPATAIDAYAGAGATAIALASRGVTVTAIEADREAAAVAERLLPPPSRVICARVEEAIGSSLPADVVLLNPPRAGVDARVCAALDEANTIRPAPRALVYVSCDPATLARDVARLPSFGIARVQGYDMFPQTAHVETVCLLVPER